MFFKILGGQLPGWLPWFRACPKLILSRHTKCSTSWMKMDSFCTSWLLINLKYKQGCWCKTKAGYAEETGDQNNTMFFSILFHLYRGLKLRIIWRHPSVVSLPTSYLKHRQGIFPSQQWNEFKFRSIHGLPRADASKSNECSPEKASPSVVEFLKLWDKFTLFNSREAIQRKYYPSPAAYDAETKCYLLNQLPSCTKLASN